MNEQGDAATVDRGKPVRIEFSFPEGQTATFSNYATVQNEGHEIYLSFFEIRPPLILGDEENKKKQLEELESVNAKCVSRIVMSTGRIPGLIQALQGQLVKAEENQMALQILGAQLQESSQEEKDE